MSLSSLLQRDRAFKGYLRGLARKPVLPRPAPALTTPPRSRNDGLVGTAFDYLLRWRLQRLNPQAEVRPWVAKAAIEKLPAGRVECGRRVLRQAMEHHATFLAGRGEVTRGLIMAAVGAAQLDTVFRSGSGAAEVGSDPDAEVIEDLTALWNSTPRGLLATYRRCVLNPTFGEASLAIGGADADLILDDMLVDVKTTKRFELERTAFDQLVGYTLLALWGGINGVRGTGESISQVGIYFARYQRLVSWPMAALVPEGRMAEAVHWLQAHLRTPSSGC